MKKFLSAVCLVALCGSSAVAESCPFNIDIQLGIGPGACFTSRNRDTNCVIIQSKEDGLLIKNLVINRGNCWYSKYDILFGDSNGVDMTDSEKRMQKEGTIEVVKHSFFNEPWKFGDKNWVALRCHYSSVLEVKVETNKGTCTYNFDHK